jgi:AcrR family transcriptional regulator
VAGEAARRDLIAAAERLFAARGIDTPSLREITREAGQKNTSALQYHFRDREALLRAVLDKHETAVEGLRVGLLDQHALAGEPDLRVLAAALVVPYVAQLDDHDGGPDYLQVVDEVISRPARFAEIRPEVLTSPGMLRWSRAVQPLLPPEAVGRPLHRRFAAIRFLHGELASRARESARRDHRLFTSHLIDLVTAILAAPVSPSTTRLLRPPTAQAPGPATRRS